MNLLAFSDRMKALGDKLERQLPPPIGADNGSWPNHSIWSLMTSFPDQRAPSPKSIVIRLEHWTIKSPHLYWSSYVCELTKLTRRQTLPLSEIGWIMTKALSIFLYIGASSLIGTFIACIPSSQHLNTIKSRNPDRYCWWLWHCRLIHAWLFSVWTQRLQMFWRWPLIRLAHCVRFFFPSQDSNATKSAPFFLRAVGWPLKGHSSKMLSIIFYFLLICEAMLISGPNRIKPDLHRLVCSNRWNQSWLIGGLHISMHDRKGKKKGRREKARQEIFSRCNWNIGLSLLASGSENCFALRRCRDSLTIFSR
jgi:hypothetical protein